MESQQALEAWLVESAQKIRFNGEVWTWANPEASPLKRRTFWRTLAVIVKRDQLERVLTRIGLPGRPTVSATLIRGRVKCTRVHPVVPPVVPNGTARSIGIQCEHFQKETTTSHTCVRFAHECESFEKNSAGASGKSMSESESTREKAAKWAQKQKGGGQAEVIDALLAAKQTKARIADLWKVLFAFAGHGFGHNPGMKERASLYAWAKEFDGHFPDPDVKFGCFLQDVMMEYSKCRAYVLEHTTWKEANDKPNVAWLYYNRDHVLAWWLSGAKANKFKGATLSS